MIVVLQRDVMFGTVLRLKGSEVEMDNPVMARWLIDQGAAVEAKVMVPDSTGKKAGKSDS